MTARRGQASLPPLAIALLVLTSVTILGLVVADGALAAADRTPDERRMAVALGERLIAADSPLTERANVLNATALSRLDGDRLRSAFPVVADRDVRVAVGEEHFVATDANVRGTTIRRLALVAETDERLLEPPGGLSGGVTLPRRTDSVELTLSPRSNDTIRTVRANDRVVLHDDSGLEGTFEVDLSARETTRLSFDANRTLSDDAVEIVLPTERTTKATLAVTVDG